MEKQEKQEKYLNNFINAEIKKDENKGQFSATYLVFVNKNEPYDLIIKKETQIIYGGLQFLNGLDFIDSETGKYVVIAMKTVGVENEGKIIFHNNLGKWKFPDQQ